MPTPFDQFLHDLRGAQGDTARLALVTLDCATAANSLLREAATAAAIPSWFDAPILAALLPEHAAEAPALVEKLYALPMVQPYSPFTGHSAWCLHEATRLALRDRLLATDPDRFRHLSRRAAAALGSPDPDAPDIRLTCEHLYHLLAGQTEEGDEAFASITGQWRSEFRTERLQTLARLLDELLAARPAPPLRPRGQGLACISVADARENQRDLWMSNGMLGDLAIAQGDFPAALSYWTRANEITERLAASDPANAGWQLDLYFSLEKLGNLAVARGELDAALRYFTGSKDIRERLAASDPANAGWQRDLWMSNGKLGDLATAQGDFPAALSYWTRANEITERLAASDPANAGRQRDLYVSLNKLGELAVARGELEAALRYFTGSKAIAERLAASDPANAAGAEDTLQRRTIAERLAASDPANAGGLPDLSFSCWVIAAKVFWPQERWAEALALMEQSLAISERLAATDPTNVMWQEDVQVTRAQVAELREKAGA